MSGPGPVGSHMGPYNPSASNPHVAELREQRIRQLQAAREAFPDRDIHETWDGFMAVPRGAEIVLASTLDALVEKLRRKPETQPE
jgi:hypothetical protein